VGILEGSNEAKIKPLAESEKADKENNTRDYYVERGKK